MPAEQKFPTGSRLELAEKCPGAFRLPWVFEVDSEPAEKGVAVHAYLEAMAKGMPRDEALKKAGKWAKLCELIDLDKMPVAGGFIPEVKYAYNVYSGKVRRIRTGGSRVYGAAEKGDIFLTIDVLGALDDMAIVVDYKTGHEVTPARDNLQIQAAALCATLDMDKESALGILLYLRHDGTAWSEKAKFEAFDVLAISDRLKRIYDRVSAEEPPELVEGDHCHYCPAFAQCPAKTSLALALSNQQTLEKWSERTLQGNAGEAYRSYMRLKEVVDRVGKNIYGYARQSPIPLGNGEFLGEVTTEKREVDGEAVWDAISALHGLDIARRAVSVDATLSSVRDAMSVLSQQLKEKGIKKTIADLEAEALKAIDERGGLKKKRTVTVKVYKEKAQP